MRIMLPLAVFALFILPLAVFGQTSDCLETWVSQRENQTPLMQWDPPPVYTFQDPLEFGATTCEIGVSLFHQAWALPHTSTGVCEISVYRAALNSGSFYIYVSSDSSAVGQLALDLSNAFGFSDRCQWSSYFTIDLKEILGTQFNSNQRYYAGVNVGSNSHAIAGLRFCSVPEQPISVETTAWGAIKQIYR